MSKVLKMISLVAAGIIAVGFVFTIIGNAITGSWGIGSTVLWPRAGAGWNDVGGQKGEQVLQPFASIEIDTTYMEIELAPSETEEYRVQYLCSGGLAVPEIVLEGNVLKIRSLEQISLRARNNRRLVRITYPANAVMNEVKISANAAEVSIDTLIVDVLEIDTDAGNALLNRVTAEEADINMKAGNLEMEDCIVAQMNIKNNAGNFEADNLHTQGLDVKMDVGNIEIDGIFEGASQFDAAMGNVAIEIRDARESYSVELDADVGNARIDGKNRYKDAYNKDAPNQITAYVNMGALDVRFSDGR